MQLPLCLLRVLFSCSMLKPSIVIQIFRTMGQTGRLHIQTASSIFLKSRTSWSDSLGKMRIPESGRGAVGRIPRNSLLSENWRVRFVTRQCWARVMRPEFCSQFCLLTFVKKVLFNFFVLVLPVSKTRRILRSTADFSVELLRPKCRDRGREWALLYIFQFNLIFKSI